MTRPTPAPRHQAFTLLEVIIALAILAVSLGVLSEVSRLSLMNSRRAAMQSEAALVAESVLGELESGAAQLVAFSSEWNPTDLATPVWRYEVAIDQTNVQGMLLARVLVTEIDPGDEQPTSLQVVRWFQDPDYIELLESQSEEAV
ncbi:hypothetical protein KOR34_00390 [Posidoniimonas corsicana]|uniref:General secretion pathway protein I n=1 Tax=Posidoniimonas corsicana TaxID=1938618 RepID=A0A5C5VBR3_9BACT|nr:type II secretion system protein [Posidoniimonas corsicana]TWT35152.1 hypothetical protein KOR34_00390 [Posidoniimonas corsicana]